MKNNTARLSNRPAMSSVVLAVSVAVGLLWLQAPRPVGHTPRVAVPPPQVDAHGSAWLAKLPMSFVENQGQWEGTAKFVARKGPLTAWCEADAITLQLAKREREDHVQSVAVRLAFEGAHPAAHLTGESPQPARFHYFRGNDPAKWHANVPSYTAVLYRHLYNGIDLKVREQDGRLEYDLLLAPNADLRQLAIRTEGVSRLEVTPNGALLMHTALGPIVQDPPTTWYELPDGTRQPIRATFVLLDATHYSFEVSNRNPQLAMVIDPALEYSTFLGGSGWDEVTAVALTASGEAIVTGRTHSPDFPFTPGAFDTSFDASAGTGLLGVYRSDVFVTRLNATGSALVYSTFLGGFWDDYANALAVDSGGVVTVGGSTTSPDFPVSNGPVPPGVTGVTAFVTRLNATGSALIYSILLGGGSVLAVLADDSGIATVAGYTSSASFPITLLGTYDPTFNGYQDGFVTRLSSTAQILFSTFLGGGGPDYIWALAPGPGGLGSGSVWVAGSTASPNFPTTTGAYDRCLNNLGPFPACQSVPYNLQSADAFLALLSNTTLTYSTLLGGMYDDRAVAIARDPSGSVTIAGDTWSADFPTTPGAYDTSFNGGGRDAFVARLDSMQSGAAQLVYSTFLGSSQIDGATAVGVDRAGAITVAVDALAADYPTTVGAYNSTFPPSYNGTTYGSVAVTRFNPSGSALRYSTFVGTGLVFGLALDQTNSATIVGYATTPTFPTTPGAFSTCSTTSCPAFLYNGFLNTEGFVTHLSMLPTGADHYGSSSGTLGSIAIGVSGIPQVGNSAFAVDFTGAPPTCPGIAAIGVAAANIPFLGGTTILIDPNQPVVFLEIPDNPNSSQLYRELSLPIPNIPGVQGTPLKVQGLFVCPGGAIGASNALAVTIQ